MKTVNPLRILLVALTLLIVAPAIAQVVDLSPGAPWTETAAPNAFPDNRVGTLHPAQGRIAVASWTTDLRLLLEFSQGDLDLLLSQDGAADAIHYSIASQTAGASEQIILSAGGDAMLPVGNYYVAVVNFATAAVPFTLSMNRVEVTPTPTPTPTATATPMPTVTPTPIPDSVYDLNHDGAVNADDLLLLMDYMSSHDARMDFNLDGASDHGDCLRFSLHWYQQTQP